MVGFGICVKMALLPTYRQFFFLISVKELSEEQKQTIVLSENFQIFIDRAGKIIERALAESVDIYTDYSGGDGEEAL